MHTNPRISTLLSSTDMLRQKESKFYTFKLKDDRNFKVVLRNIHPSADPEDIKTELQEAGHEVQHIYNIKHKQTKQPLPIFFIELKANTTNKDIYNITSLLQT